MAEPRAALATSPADSIDFRDLSDPADAPGFSVSEPIASRRFSRGEIAGIDMPGIGHVRAGGGLSYEVAAIEKLVPATVPRKVSMLANAMRKESIARAGESTLRGRTPKLGDFPEALQRELDGEEREGSLIQLMFAARRLAAHSISQRLPWGPDLCLDCGAVVYRLGEKMQHRRGCCVGDLASAIDELENQQLKSQTKEEASTGETSRAGEGIRTPGMKQRVCMLCGEIGGVWEGEYSDGAVDLSLLGLNQRVGPGIGCIGRTLYTHRCKGGAR